jgi:RNA polymerase sigma-70 factor (ECF subfamily)
MWPDQRDTQQLLDAAQAGDAAARERLWTRHRGALHKLVALRLDRGIQGRVDVSDVVQDALVEADRRLEDYLRQGSSMPFHLWLRQIARDRMIDAHRRHRGAERRSIDREQAPPSPSLFADRSAFDLAAQLRDGRELTPAAALLQRELETRFREALEKVDPMDREILELRHIEQLSNRDTALALGLSEPAAGMRYLRALRRLRALLDETPSLSGHG